MSVINVIQNPSFSDELNEWNTYGWYAGNTITWKSAGGATGSCVELAVPTEKGQSYIYQVVYLEAGTYEAKIKAKKISGNADVWIQVYAGGWYYSPSLRNMIDDQSFTEISYLFSISSAMSVQIRYIVGSAEGVIRLDDATLLADVPDLIPGVLYYADVSVNNNGLKVRKLPSTSGQTLGFWPNNRKAVVTGISGNTEWAECRWRGQVAYVSKSYLTNIISISNIYDYGTVLRTVGAAERTTGTHQVKFYATGYDEGSLWCHLFADWVVGHSIWDAPYLPKEANCREGVIKFLKEEKFVFVNAWHKNDVWEHCENTSQWMDSSELDSFESHYTPYAGDYVYFRKCSEQSGYSAGETAYHVGIVLSCAYTGSKISVTVLEGNSSGSDVVNGIGIITYDPSSETDLVSSGRFHRNILGFAYACGLG